VDQRDQPDPPVATASVAPRRLLGLPEFRALVGARSTNALAVSALATVVAFQTYEITRDPLALGWLGLVEAIPALSLVLFGGHLADRRDRRAIVVVTSAIVTATAAVLAVLSAAGLLSLIGILAVIFATGIASGFERPALTALEAQVVPREDAARGISILSSVSLSGGIVGPAVGGIAIALVGIAATYAGIAILLAISTACLALISSKPIPAPIEGEPMLQSLLGGIRYVARTPALVGSMALDLFAVFFGGAIALLPIFATDILQVGAIGLGLLRTAPSIGALLVMLIATRRPPSRHAGRMLLLSVAGFGLSMIVFGSSTIFALSLVALFFAGVTDGVSMIIRNTILRVLSPERIRGRVASVNWVFIGASNELGAFESGVAARVFGTVPSVIGGGILTLAVVGATALLVPSLRTLDIDRAAPSDDGAPDDDGPAASRSDAPLSFGGDAGR
jgi:MFS family permease